MCLRIPKVNHNKHSIRRTAAPKNVVLMRTVVKCQARRSLKPTDQKNGVVAGATIRQKRIELEPVAVSSWTNSMKLR